MSIYIIQVHKIVNQKIFSRFQTHSFVFISKTHNVTRYITPYIHLDKIWYDLKIKFFKRNRLKPKNKFWYKPKFIKQFPVTLISLNRKMVINKQATKNLYYFKTKKIFDINYCWDNINVKHNKFIFIANNFFTLWSNLNGKKHNTIQSINIKIKKISQLKSCHTLRFPLIPFTKRFYKANHFRAVSWFFIFGENYYKSQWFRLIQPIAVNVIFQDTFKINNSNPFFNSKIDYNSLPASTWFSFFVKTYDTISQSKSFRSNIITSKSSFNNFYFKNLFSFIYISNKNKRNRYKLTKHSIKSIKKSSQIFSPKEGINSTNKIIRCYSNSSEINELILIKKIFSNFFVNINEFRYIEYYLVNIISLYQKNIGQFRKKNIIRSFDYYIAQNNLDRLWNLDFIRKHFIFSEKNLICNQKLQKKRKFLEIWFKNFFRFAFYTQSYKNKLHKKYFLKTGEKYISTTDFNNFFDRFRIVNTLEIFKFAIRFGAVNDRFYHNIYKIFRLNDQYIKIYKQQTYAKHPWQAWVKFDKNKSHIKNSNNKKFNPLIDYSIYIFCLKNYKQLSTSKWAFRNKYYRAQWASLQAKLKKKKFNGDNTDIRIINDIPFFISSYYYEFTYIKIINKKINSSKTPYYLNFFKYDNYMNNVIIQNTYSNYTKLKIIWHKYCFISSANLLKINLVNKSKLGYNRKNNFCNYNNILDIKFYIIKNILKNVWLKNFFFSISYANQKSINNYIYFIHSISLNLQNFFNKRPQSIYTIVDIEWNTYSANSKHTNILNNFWSWVFYKYKQFHDFKDQIYDEFYNEQNQINKVTIEKRIADVIKTKEIYQKSVQARKINGFKLEFRIAKIINKKKKIKLKQTISTYFNIQYNTIVKPNSYTKKIKFSLFRIFQSNLNHNPFYLFQNKFFYSAYNKFYIEKTKVQDLEWEDSVKKKQKLHIKLYTHMLCLRKIIKKSALKRFYIGPVRWYSWILPIKTRVVQETSRFLLLINYKKKQRNIKNQFIHNCILPPEYYIYSILLKKNFYHQMWQLSISLVCQDWQNNSFTNQNLCYYNENQIWFYKSNNKTIFKIHIDKKFYILFNLKQNWNTNNKFCNLFDFNSFSSVIQPIFTPKLLIHYPKGNFFYEQTRPKFVVIRSAHIFKTSREQFEKRTFKGSIRFKFRTPYFHPLYLQNTNFYNFKISELNQPRGGVRVELWKNIIIEVQFLCLHKYLPILLKYRQ